MASYVFCRVCDERHDTYDKALADLTGLVRDERYYTRNETPPRIMRRTPMIGIGAHGGRGLFVMGLCAGLRWEALTDQHLPYRHRIEVIWDGAIYRADYDAVFESVAKYNQRSWTSANRADYRLVLDRILDGEIVQRVRERPDLPWEDAG
jgi:hypothetical protein